MPGWRHLLKGEAAVQTSGCRRSLELSLGERAGNRLACSPCAHPEDLLQWVSGLQETLRGLCNIKEAEKELDSWFQAQSAVNPPPMAKQPETPLVVHTEGRGSNNAEEWKLAAARTSRRERLPPKPEVLLQNRFTALQTEDERPVTSREMLELSKTA